MEYKIEFFGSREGFKKCLLRNLEELEKDIEKQKLFKLENINKEVKHGI